MPFSDPALYGVIFTVIEVLLTARTQGEESKTLPLDVLKNSYICFKYVLKSLIYINHNYQELGHYIKKAIVVAAPL